jgi:hypothetical protein
VRRFPLPRVPGFCVCQCDAEGGKTERKIKSLSFTSDKKTVYRC